MKKICIALFVAAGLLYGCTKDDSAPVFKDITGTWKYIGYSGGFAGFGFMPVDTLENYIQVDTAGARIMFVSNNNKQCTTYSFEKAADGTYRGIITLADTVLNENRFDVYLNHDTLTLYPHDWADGFNAHYKISPQHFDWCTGINGH